MEYIGISSQISSDLQGSWLTIAVAQSLWGFVIIAIVALVFLLALMIISTSWDEASLLAVEYETDKELEKLIEEAKKIETIQ